MLQTVIRAITRIADIQIMSYLRKPRVLSPLRSLRKERSEFSTLGLQR